MEWYQVLSIVAANVVMFLWLRTESNSDRRDFAAAMRNIHEDMNKQMQDFHGRLCAIEERTKK